MNLHKACDPANIISEILHYVYEFLVTDPRVIRPGSVRAYEAAAADIYMRLLLEGNVDERRFCEIVKRIGIENLLLSVETQTPDEKKIVLEEAFNYAITKVMRNVEEEVIRRSAELEEGKSQRGEKAVRDSEIREGEGQTKGKKGQGKLSNIENKDFRERDEVTETAIDNIRFAQRRSEISSTYPAGITKTTGEVMDFLSQEFSEDENLENMISAIYEAFYGGVGTVNFMNLAQLINMFVRYDASIVRKAQVLRKLERYLRVYGLVPQTTFTKLVQNEKKVLEEFRKRTRGHSSDTAQMKVMKFSGSDRYPTYIVTTREFKFGDSYSNIDLYKTAMNISRKIIMGKLITSRDLIVKEYANVKSIDLVLCLDVSGSMRELSWGIQKIEIAKDAVAKYVQFLMNTNDRLALVLFNFRADVLWTLHQVRKFWRYMLYLLSYVYAGGGTNLAHALERAREILTKSRSTAKHVVCVTDGRTVNAQLCIKETIRLRRQGATVSTIAVGENSDDDLLMRISRIGGGLFIKINNIYDLSRALIIDKLHLI